MYLKVKYLAVLTFLIIGAEFTYSQSRIFTKSGTITFSSDAPMEKIEAINRRVVSIIDTESGAIEFSVLIRSFEFEKALMQEHFNEDYLESIKYPKAIFKGKITNISAIDFKKEGKHTAKIAGELTIHGITNKVESLATFTVKKGKISAKSDFKIKLADYGIKIPSVVTKNIAEIVDVSVLIESYEPFKK